MGQRQRRRWVGRIAAGSALAAALLTIAPAGVRADRIVTRGGNRFVGKLVEDPRRKDRWELIGPNGRTPMILRKDEVVQVIPEASPLDEYVRLREQPRPTAEAEHALATWCDEHKLPDLARVHDAAALKLDPEFGPAHARLGHVEWNGRWLDADQLKEAQGLVKFQGHWVLPAERDRLEAAAAEKAEGASWARRIERFRDTLREGTPDQAREVERKLESLNDPAAVPAVAQTLGTDANPAIRALGARALGAIAGPRASAALVDRLAAEGDDAARRAIMAEISRRDPDEVVPGLVAHLRDQRPPVVNRVAWALGNLNAVRAVPKLIPVLVAVDNEVVVEPGTTAVASGPGFSSGSSFSVPVLTPPAVGPGVVAFGATSVPFTSGVSLGGPQAVSTGPTTRLVPVERRNPEVRDALIRLTGRDFGYDVATWSRWAATSFRVEEGPARRVIRP